MKLVKSIPALTPREVEIVRLLRKGYSNKEIAQELGIAVTTVKWNMTNILGKFEVQSSRQLLALFSKLPPTILANGRLNTFACIMLFSQCMMFTILP